MAGRRIDKQLRDLAARKKLQGQSASSVEADLLKAVSKRHIYRLAKLYQRTGSATSKKRFGRTLGRPRKLNHKQTTFLLKCHQKRVRSTSQSLLTQLHLHHGIYNISARSINRYQHRSGLSFKKITTQAREGDPLMEKRYWVPLGMIRARQPICLDETRINDTTGNSGYGWSDIGARAVVEQPFGRGRGFSAIAVLTHEGLIGVPVIEGAYNVEEIIRMLEVFVFPFSNPYPGPNSVIIWDNPKIHKNVDVLEAIADKGMRILNTPPYMPKYQPDELVFGTVKNWLRRHPWYIRTDPRGPFRAIRALFYECIKGPQAALRYMEHCGIHVDWDEM
ncbi:hypothetical protein P7C70_g4067, partial [Phenoliferia sp. Uapishka_3]